MDPHISVQCPYCWQDIQVEIGYESEKREFVEDCEVCCRPIKIICSRNEENDDASVHVERENE